jgi:hypothetical protein
MTDTELNRAVAKKLGLPWHEASLFTDKVNYKCSCGGLFRVELITEHITASNPDFTQNAKVLLETLKEKLGEERYRKFINSFTSYTDHRPWTTYKPTVDFIDEFILNPRQLCEKFLEFMEGK